MRKTVDPESVAFTRRRELPGVEIMTVRDSRRLWRGFDERCRLVLSTPDSSTLECSYRGRTLEYGRVVDTILLLPGEAHANLRNHGPLHFDVLFFEPDVTRTLLQERGVSIRRIEELPAFLPSAGLRTRLALLVDSFRLPSIAALESESLLLECFDALLAGNPRTRHLAAPTPSAVARARDRLLDCLSENVSLDALARDAGMDRFTLLRAFKRRYAVPPHRYQVYARAARASVLLRAGESAVAVAGQVGFADQSHLVRAFQAVFGTTPGKYQRAGAP